MTNHRTRPLHADDHARWRELFAGYAAFYGAAMNDEIAQRVWAWLHDPDHVLEGIVVEDAASQVVGFVHVRACPRPLGGNEIGFLDDMFVDPDARGSGAADALFAALRELAERNGWPAIRWVTQHFNERARRFYDRYTNGPSDFILYHWAPATSG